MAPASPPDQTPAADRHPTNLISPAALMAIKNLELRARMVVEGFWHGLHRSPYHGFSVEFTEYRQYTPGDDPRYLDWRLYARSDRYYLKKFEDETNLRCYLLVDQSRSMDFGSPGWTKAQYAQTLAATLAAFLHRQGDAIGLLTFAGDLRAYLPARHRAGHLRRLMLQLEQAADGAATNLTTPLRRISEIARKRSLLVLLSDFLAPLETLAPHLTTLTAAGHEVILFQVLDPAELTFNFERAILFRDAESHRDLFVDPATVRTEYLQRLARHNDALRATCQRLGAGFIQLGTGQPLELALFDFLRERQQRARTSNRHGRPIK